MVVSRRVFECSQCVCGTDAPLLFYALVSIMLSRARRETRVKFSSCLQHLHRARTVVELRIHRADTNRS
jgi:hypothetical protein